MPLYSVKNKFYRRLQRGALNGKQQINSSQQQQTATARASTPSFYSWGGTFYSWGGTPNLPYFFSLQKKTLRAAPCRPHPAGGLCKKLAPCAAVRRTNLFWAGHFTTAHSWGGAPNPPYFFHCKKVSKKLAPREAIKFIFIRAFYNSLRSDK